MRLSLMIEGQEDVAWDQWLTLADACEQHGLEGLFRSDHYASVQGRQDRGSLDAWATLAALGPRTSRIRLGTMVSPATFRHPSVLAKNVVTADHTSDGRVELGMGTGWLEEEHRRYGFPFPELATRFDRLEEQVEIVVRQWTEEVFDFHGEHYRLEGCRALPKPVQRPRPPLIIGGSAGDRSAALCARWGDEYNTIFCGPETAGDRRENVVDAFEAAGRDPSELTFSVMTGCVVGTDRAELESRGRALMDRNGETGAVGEYLGSLGDEWIIGTVDEVVDQLAAMGDAGVDRMMLQHLVHGDVEMVGLLGEVQRQVA